MKGKYFKISLKRNRFILKFFFCFGSFGFIGINGVLMISSLNSSTANPFASLTYPPVQCASQI